MTSKEFNLGDEDTYFSYTGKPSTSRFVEMMDDHLDYNDADAMSGKGRGVSPDGYTTHGIGVLTGLKDDHGDDSWYPDIAINADQVEGKIIKDGALPYGGKKVATVAAKMASDAVLSSVSCKISTLLTWYLLSWATKGLLLQPYVIASIVSIALLGGSASARQMNHNSLGRFYGLALADVVPTVLFGVATWYWWFDRKINVVVSIGLSFAAGVVTHWLLGLKTPLNKQLGL
jgi:hypothetical protein